MKYKSLAGSEKSRLSEKTSFTYIYARHITTPGRYIYIYTSVKNEANGGNGTLREGICIDIATASRGGILREKAALNIFKYLVENGFVFDKSCYLHCMSRDFGFDLCLLKYIHEEMNYEWDETWTQRASQEGNLYALKYLHENGCPWNECTCMTKYLECLKYAHENGCPWGYGSYIDAFLHFNLDMIEYLTENECPIDKRINTHVFIAGVINMWVQGTGYEDESIFHDLLKGCVKYFVSSGKYIDMNLLQSNHTAFTLNEISQISQDYCDRDCFAFAGGWVDGCDKLTYVLVFLRDTVGLKFDTSLITYLFKLDYWETAIDLLNDYSTPYDVENILRECDDDNTIFPFKEWLEENNEEEYIKYFVQTTKKDIVKIQELIDDEKENISNGSFVMMNELLKKIYDDC